MPRLVTLIAIAADDRRSGSAKTGRTHANIDDSNDQTDAAVRGDGHGVARAAQARRPRW